MVSRIPTPEPKVSGIPNLDLRISESYQKSGIPVSIPCFNGGQPHSAAVAKNRSDSRDDGMIETHGDDRGLYTSAV